jgi:Fe-S oxidoreductase
MWYEKAILALLILGSLGLFATFVDVRWEAVRRARGGLRTDRPGRRILRFLSEVVFQSKVIRQRPGPGLLHAFVFWGFMAFGLETLDHFFEGFGGTVLGHGDFRAAFAVFVAAWSLVVLVGILGLAYRRFVTRPETLGKFSWGSLIVADLISILMITYLIAFITGHQKGDSTLGTVNWWVHSLAILGFLVVIPNSKHLHLVLSPITTFTKDFQLGRVRPLDFENEEFGAENLVDLHAHTALGAMTCVECGRCHDHCPATQTDKLLDPKQVMLLLRRGFLENPEQPAVGDVIPEEMIWQCTTCGSCTYQCPVGIDQVVPIIEMRRGKVAAGELPDETMMNFFQNLERRHNPWGYPVHKSEEILEELDLPAYDGQEVLYWMGCLARYDADYQKVVRAFVGLLRRAGVSFGVLTDERCTGDAARRAGNEFAFQELAQHNIELLNAARPKTVLTTCPHCLRTLREYEDLGLREGIELVHHTTYLDRLIADGKLPRPAGDGRVTYHDPCYLSRYEHPAGVEEPRGLLRKAGLEIVEPRRTAEQSLCCGAGGGMVFAEETKGKRINHERVDELLETEPSEIAVSCPFCPIMLRDGLGHRERPDVAVKDVAELISERLPEA